MEAEFKESLEKWQNSHSIVLPFYSMDWMSRFYSILTDTCEISLYRGNDFSVALRQFVEDAKDALGTTNEYSQMTGILSSFVPKDLMTQESKYSILDVSFEKRFSALYESEKSIGTKLNLSIINVLGSKIKAAIEVAVYHAFFSADAYDSRTPSYHEVLTGLLREANNSIIDSLNGIGVTSDKVPEIKEILESQLNQFNNSDDKNLMRAFKECLNQISIQGSKW